MKVLNYTPHALLIENEEGEFVKIVSSGIARCDTTKTPMPSVAGFSVTSVSYGEVTGLPNEEPDTIIVVSAMTRDACQSRGDLFSPGELVRDADGNIIGAKGLYR